MNKQMEMAFMKQGGIKDDGMTKDPVSGNNIPPGSMATEVRDDIPAMLSEGEYVVPADVLRYYGVNFFENLRGQAKNGLQSMEQNGRIGGTPMTQQDVARNMQQPMAAAQGAMMQSPIRVQQQGAPQAMGNTMQQNQAVATGYITGGYQAPKSNLSLANLMGKASFQNTSSYQQNVAKAQEEAKSQTITTMVKHFNTAGESIMIRYDQLPGGVAAPAPGQESELAKYPMTEAEYLAYKKGLGGGSGGGGGGGGGKTTPTGSDMSWVDGVDWQDKASVEAWTEETLGMSKEAELLATKGGILGAAPQVVQANDIAKVRAMADMYESIGDTDMAKYLNDSAQKSVDDSGSLVISALERLGLMTGKSIAKSASPKFLSQFSDRTQDMVVEKSGDYTGATVYKPGGIDVAMVDKDKKGGLSAAEKAAIKKSQEASAANKIAMEKAQAAGASSDDVADLREEFEEAGGTWATGGRAEGGLMATPKKKKKRQPKKGGLAGKK